MPWRRKGLKSSALSVSLENAQATNRLTAATNSGASQAASPSSRATSRPLRSMITVVGRPRAPKARAAAPRGSSQIASSFSPRR